MDWLRDVATIVAILSSAFALWKAWRMTPHEEGASDASAAKSYAEAAELAQGWAKRLNERLTACETKVHEIEAENERLREENKFYLGTLTNWSVGITLLLTQIGANQLTAAWFPIPEVLERFVEKGRKK